MKVSVIIKALNEERNIVRAIESALAAVEHVGGGEVILADSLSTDRTVQLASRYPVRIVQLTDPADRCCGVGAELGYRVAQGEYLYILDADMELDGAFLAAAIRKMDDDPFLGGVGGLVQEMHVANAEFRRRSSESPAHFQPGEVDRLNGGGLFRKAAIDRMGYLTNRNLHGYEEYELALRLRAAGWRLYRLNQLAVKHYGHTDTSFSLLWRRWRGRYAWGAGELLREVLGKPYFKEALSGIAQYRLTVIVMAWWLLLVGTFIAGFSQTVFFILFVVLLVAPLLFGMLRKRSFTDGLYMVVSQNVQAAGVIAGFFSRQRGDPKSKPSFKIII